MAEIEDASSASEASAQESQKESEESFGDAYLEVELYMERTKMPAPEMLEVATDIPLDFELPHVPSPSNMERKRSYRQQKQIKAYEMAALQGLSQVYQTFDF